MQKVALNSPLPKKEICLIAMTCTMFKKKMEAFVFQWKMFDFETIDENEIFYIIET